jgi:hypothetical protein
MFLTENFLFEFEIIDLGSQLLPKLEYVAVNDLIPIKGDCMLEPVC